MSVTNMLEIPCCEKQCGKGAHSNIQIHVLGLTPAKHRLSPGNMDGSTYGNNVSWQHGRDTWHIHNSLMDPFHMNHTKHFIFAEVATVTTSPIIFDRIFDCH